MQTVTDSFQAAAGKASFIRKMFEKGIELKQQYGADAVCDFSLGNPDVPPPEAARAVLHQLADEAVRPLGLGYCPNAGIPAVVARRKGEERQADANRVLRNSMVLILLLSLVLMAIFLPFATPLLRFAGAEAGRTLEDSVTYFLIVCGALPFNALSMGICAAQRGVGNTKLTMYVNVFSNLINVLFNWLLINGVGPFPKLGVTGAAIATAIGLIAGFVLSLLSVLNTSKANSFLKISFRDDWRLHKESVTDVTKIAKSSMVEQLAMRIGFFGDGLDFLPFFIGDFGQVVRSEHE